MISREGKVPEEVCKKKIIATTTPYHNEVCPLAKLALIRLCVNSPHVQFAFDGPPAIRRLFYFFLFYFIVCKVRRRGGINFRCIYSHRIPISSDHIRCDRIFRSSFQPLFENIDQCTQSRKRPRPPLERRSGSPHAAHAIRLETFKI